MTSLRTLILVSASLLQACVSGGSGEQAAIGGAVLVFSHLARSAQSGDLSAKRSWCSAFSLVQQRASGSDGTKASDDLLINELTPAIHALMRQNGYALHRQQINIVIKDALNVSRNPTALTAMTESCN